MTKKHDAAARYARLRAAGVSPRAAWYLSGGVMGSDTDDGPGIPLARIARDVADCEAFLADYRAMA